MTEPGIIFEDDNILLVNKPAGITVIPDRIHTTRETLQSLLQKGHGRLFVVHRLDKDTSGVICFAKDEVSHKALSLQFQNHTVNKIYKALVKGRVANSSGTIKEPIAENPSWPGTMKVNKRGKEALSIYEVLESFDHATLLQVEIKTGRTHQIRVHMAFIGHPLLVDEIYGQTSAFYLSSVKRGYKFSGEEERPTISRLTLHASELSLVHPLTGQAMKFNAPLPKDMETVLRLLRKYDSK